MSEKTDDLWKKVRDLNKEIERIQGNIRLGIIKKKDIETYQKEVGRLSDEKDNIVKEIAQIEDNEFKEKEAEFNAFEYKNSDAEIILDNIISGKLNKCYVQDFEYGEWQKEVPEGWDLDRYFNAMIKLEDLFMHLHNFCKDESGHFVVESLTVVKDNVPLKMTFMNGQGSDFIVTKVTKDADIIIIKWDDAIMVSKMKPYDQAVWYAKNIIGMDESNSEFARTMFILGQYSSLNYTSFRTYK